MSQQAHDFVPNPVLRAMFDDQSRRVDPVVAELVALREAIQELRNALLPPQSIILTGPAVERIYQALKDTP